MKVLHIIPSLKKGGAERLCLDICRELASRTHVEIRIILLHSHYEYSLLSSRLPISVVDFDFSFHILKACEGDFGSYDKIVCEFKPDIIHSHLFEAEFFSRERIHSSAVYFSHLHDNMAQFENFSFQMALSKNRITNFFEKQHLLRNYKNIRNYFIANSADTFEYFKRRLSKLLQKNLRLLPNAMDLTSFPFRKRDFPVKEIHLINIGSFVPKKNQTFLVDVMESLKKHRVDAHLHLLGDGPQHNAIYEKIKSKKLENLITLHGNVHDVNEFLAKSNIYMHAATYEPFGLAILEAMATGLPVVCLDGGGNRELIEDGKNGFILKQATPEQFARKALKIISDEEHYQQFSNYARSTAEKYDIKDYVDRLLLLYEEALKNR